MFSALKHWLFPRESNNQRARILHPYGMTVLIVLVVVFQLGITWFSRVNPQILGYASQITPQQIIDITNTKRREQGLGVLKYDSQLTAAAAAKGADMMARNYWAHVSPVGTQPWFFVTQSGYGYRYAGENLARDFADAQSVVNAWIDSPSHRENLYNPKYLDIGVAVIDGRLMDNETTLVVQMFGTRLSAQATPRPPEVASIETVKAAEVLPAVVDEPKPLASPFDVSRVVFLVILGVLALVLVIDVIEIRRQKILRWTSKSMAHLLFVLVLIIAILLVSRGKII